MIVSKSQFLANKKFYIEKILSGAVFIYPTDTIYGIGCVASNKSSVSKIRELKNRDAKPFSVIAPSKHWIETNCVVDASAKKLFQKLPGKYTFILKLKNKSLSPNENLETIGVRIPKHWFSAIVETIGQPIITTSVNRAGKLHMTSLKNLNPQIRDAVDFIIYDGKRDNKPSKIFNLVTNERMR